jgi:triacylglycerol esterase/lipase EstA (alpha/beta hydrolase family)
LQSDNLVLLPVVNNLDHGIEQRAGSLSNLLPKMLKKLQANQCHLIGYSLSGIDARFAISQLGLAPFVKSLSTISTPHQGSRLAWLSERRVLR